MESARDERYRGEVRWRQMGKSMGKNFCRASKLGLLVEEVISMHTIRQLCNRGALVARFSVLLDDFESRTFSPPSRRG